MTAFVCVALVAFMAITAPSIFVLIDAETPLVGLFGAVCTGEETLPEATPLPGAPSVEVLSPRAPPQS
jgi:hypothetical protein